MPIDTLELDDPKAMRALAHPARLTILEQLQAEGTANATECAREIGCTPQAASYHLRALAKWGLIRRVASADGRESRWALAAGSIVFRTDGEDSRTVREAARLLGRRVLERDERYVAEFLVAEDELEAEWRDAATLSSGTVFVTSDELAELRHEVRGLVARFRRSDPKDRPAGSRRVHVVFRAVPRMERKSRQRRR